MGLADAVKKPQFWLRLLEMVFSIVAFACIADWAEWSRYGYTVFVGVSSTIVCLAFMMIYICDMQVHAAVALGIDTLWACLWLISAALMTDDLTGWPGNKPNKLKTSVGFAWTTWVLFLVSMVLDFVAHRKGESV